MKSSHFYYIILFSFLLAACKDDGPGEKENSDNDVPSVATNTWLLNSLDNIENYSNSDPENRYDINMVRNEYESVQLVIQTDSKKSLKIERIGNNDAIEFQCRKLEAFNGKYDVLIPCDNEIEPDDKVVRAWLTFKVKSEAEAKRHKSYDSNPMKKNMPYLYRLMSLTPLCQKLHLLPRYSESTLKISYSPVYRKNKK